MKCKNCKQEFEKYRFNQKYCFNPECVKVWVDIEKKNQWKKNKSILKERIEKRSELLMKAQRIFNYYIRLRDLYSACISCGKKPSKINAGHYFSIGGHSNVRFDPDNVHIQCEPCNNNLSGNLIPYRKNLINKIGQDRFDQLEERAYREKYWSPEELKELIKVYKIKAKELKE